MSVCLFVFVFVCLFVCLFVCFPSTMITARRIDTKQKVSIPLGSGHVNYLMTFDLEVNLTSGQKAELWVWANFFSWDLPFDL